MSDIPQSQLLRIQTADEVELSALLLPPGEGDPDLRIAVPVLAGTAIRKEFYLRFASWLRGRGFTVLLFDYRGVGQSRPESLRDFDAHLHEWGQKDAATVLDWLHHRYPEYRKVAFAHSMGSQMLGLMHNHHLLSGAVTVAGSGGNWHNYASPQRYAIPVAANLFFPLALRLWNYVPGKLFRLGQDWTRGLTEEWLENSRRNTLLSEYFGEKLDRTYYDEVRYPIQAWFLSDDYMATPKTIDNLSANYPAAEVTTRLIYPDDLQLKRVGHFGFFRMGELPLWSQVAEAMKVMAA